MVELIGPSWEIKNVEAVLFDKDGTLIDSHIYWGEIIKRRSRALIGKLKLNESIYEPLCLTMGFSLADEKLLPNGPIALVSREEVIKILTDYFDKKNIKTSREEITDIFLKAHTDFLKEFNKYTKILPGAKEALGALKEKGVKTVLITSDSIKNTTQIVEYLGLQDYFDLLIGKELTPEPKATGMPAIIACKKLDIDPENTICVGDAPMDLLMAENANLKACIAISLGQTPYAELKKISKYIVKDYSELTIK